MSFADLSKLLLLTCVDVVVFQSVNAKSLSLSLFFTQTHTHSLSLQCLWKLLLLLHAASLFSSWPQPTSLYNSPLHSLLFAFGFFYIFFKSFHIHIHTHTLTRIKTQPWPPRLLSNAGSSFTGNVLLRNGFLFVCYFVLVISFLICIVLSSFWLNSVIGFWFFLTKVWTF